MKSAPRARETAEATVRVFQAPISIREDLIDLDYGAWSGLLPEEAGQQDPEAFGLSATDTKWAIPPGGEPLSAVADRELKAL